MSTEQNKALVREHYAAFLAKDWDAITRQVGPEFTDHDAPPGIGRGPESVKQYLAMLLRAFPDIQITVEDEVAEGNLVAVRAKWRATHRGEFLGIPATNREVAFSGMVFWRIENGHLVERWANMDRVSLMRQLQGAS